MPPKSSPLLDSGLIDTWGRRNRQIPDHACEACGATYRPARRTSRFCSRPCQWSKNGGSNKKAESWWINSRGYIEGRLWLPDGTQACIKRHRFVMEGIMGRALLPTEDVHHRDGNKQNNDPSNLELIEHGAHSSLHNAERDYRRGYSLILSDEERKARSSRAIASQLSVMGRTAKAVIAKAEAQS